MTLSDRRDSRIMCDYCSDFAQATLEGANLCSGCLMRRLMSTRDSSLFDRLEPLAIEGSGEASNSRSPQAQK